MDMTDRGRSSVRIRGALVSGLAAAGLLLPVGGVRAAEPLRLVVDSPPLTMTMLDMMEPGPSLGDLRVFEAPATASDGRSGTRSFFSVTTDTIGPDDVTEDQIGILSLDFGDGDTIVIGGVSVIVEEGATIPASTPIARPILGGTGAFAGIRGEAQTTRAEDGSYRDALTILGSGSPLTEMATYSTAGGARTDMDMDRSGDAGFGLGDVRVVELPLIGGDDPAGFSLGVHVRTHLPADAADVYASVGMLVHDLGGGDRIFSAGSVREAQDGLPPVGVGSERAIVGGTGRFAGARGTLTSTHVGDGVMDYVARLTTEAPDGATTLDMPWTATTSSTPAIDLAMSGPEPALADVRVWQQALTAGDGTTGTADGLLFTVDMTAPDDPLHERLGLWFDSFDDGSQIAIVWFNGYRGAVKPMDAPAIGAVVGGTGRFVGAAGFVEVTRTDGGGYRHVFHLEG